MEENTLELRRCLFGGYEREGVLVCVRDLMGQLEQARTEADKVQSLHDALTLQNQQLYSQLTDQSKNMEQLIAQLADQKVELDAYHARETRMEEQEDECYARVEDAKRQAQRLLAEARLEQERITDEALHARKKAITDTEQRLKELRSLAEELWVLLGAKGVNREAG